MKLTRLLLAIGILIAIMLPAYGTGDNSPDCAIYFGSGFSRSDDRSGDYTVEANGYAVYYFSDIYNAPGPIGVTYFGGNEYDLKDQYVVLSAKEDLFGGGTGGITITLDGAFSSLRYMEIDYEDHSWHYYGTTDGIDVRVDGKTVHLDGRETPFSDTRYYDPHPRTTVVDLVYFVTEEYSAWDPRHEEPVRVRQIEISASGYEAYIITQVRLFQ